ncbi:MAG: YiiX/YebB-like N1pC/P60 family cysteine hydrolase [Bdellovibrionota bacterium]
MLAWHSTKKAQQWVVYEAWNGVEKTALQAFLTHVEQNAGDIYIKRPPLKKKEHKRIKKWLEQKMGLPYDPDFLIHNDKYYCSELITDAFQAIQKQPIFGYLPMYYGDLHNKDDATAKIWIKYFKEKNMPIPQHKPGISPLGLYLNAALTSVLF